MEEPKINVTQLDVATVDTEKIVEEKIAVKSNKKRNIIIGIVAGIITIVVIIAIVLGVVLSNKAKTLDPFRATNLKKVIIVTRHGARTSFENLPVDISEPWQCDLPQLVSYEKQLLLLNDSKPTPCPPGELVKHGFQQHSELGLRWKKDYIDTGFLNSTYDKSEVYLRSTNTTRTRASLLGQLSTMFPAQNLFAVDQASSLNDGFHPPYPCKWQSDFQKSIYVDNATLFPAQPLTEINAALKTTKWAYNILYDSLVAILGRGDPLPSVLTKPQFDQVQTANNHFWASWFCNGNVTRAETIVKINVGPMFAVLRDMVANQPQKLFIVSAHDTTVSPLMSVLTRFDWGCGQPKFAANVAIEVNLQGQVSVKYDGVAVTTLKCKDGSVCEEDEFKALLEGFDVKDGQGRLDLCNAGF